MVFKIYFSFSWIAQDKVWLQTLQWNTALSELTEEIKGYFTVHFFLNLFYYLAASVCLAFFTTQESVCDSKLAFTVLSVEREESMLPVCG